MLVPISLCFSVVIMFFFGWSFRILFLVLSFVLIFAKKFLTGKDMVFGSFLIPLFYSLMNMLTFVFFTRSPRWLLLLAFVRRHPGPHAWCTLDERQARVWQLVVSVFFSVMNPYPYKRSPPVPKGRCGKEPQCFCLSVRGLVVSSTLCKCVCLVADFESMIF